MIKIVYFSSSERALPGLELLHKNLEIAGIISQPDKPVGRKNILTPTAISQFAVSHNIPLLKPEKLDQEAIDWIKSKNPDVMVLAYYGLLIPLELLNLTESGIIVTHPSLLPRWRWGTPVQATLINGDQETGVSLMKMDEKFDHGPIIAIQKEPLSQTLNQEELYVDLFTKGAKLLVKTLPDYLSGKIKLIEQDHTKATYAKHIKKEHGHVPPNLITLALQGDAFRSFQGKIWEMPFMLQTDKTSFSYQPSSELLERFIRAMNPWPSAWTEIRIMKNEVRSMKLKLLKSHLEAAHLVLDVVQLEGKNPVTWKQFVQGYPNYSF